MLCLQDCIDMCDVTPDEESLLRENVTLAEISEALVSGVHQTEANAWAMAPERPEGEVMLFEIYPDFYHGSPVVHSVRL